MNKDLFSALKENKIPYQRYLIFFLGNLFVLTVAVIIYSIKWAGPTLGAVTLLLQLMITVLLVRKGYIRVAFMLWGLFLYLLGLLNMFWVRTDESLLPALLAFPAACIFNGLVNDNRFSLAGIACALTVMAGTVYQPRLFLIDGIVISGLSILLATLSYFFRRILRMYQKQIKGMEDQLEKMAEENTKIQRHFLSQISHELRTPLTAIIGFSDLLMDVLRRNAIPRGGESYQEHLDAYEDLKAIHNSGRYLLFVVNTLLDTAKLESGQIMLMPSEERLDVLIKQINGIAKMLIEESGRPLEYRAPANLVGTVMVDQLRVQQILVSLLSNAVKYTPHGTIGLDVQNTTDSILFAVTDTGIGISPEMQEFIFQPFRQATPSPFEHHSGIGMGLFMARSLARLHGGDIAVESRPGKGSKFILEIPLELPSETSLFTASWQEGSLL